MGFYNLKVFGKSIDIDWMSRSNREIKTSIASTITSKHDYDIYTKLCTNTTEDEKVLYNTNSTLFSLYDVLMKPFLSTSLAEMQSKFKEPDKTKIKEALMEAKMILKDLLGVRYVNIAYDFSDEKFPYKRNLMIFIDKIRLNNEDVTGDMPLNFVLDKASFYKFSDAESVMVSVIVPVHLLKDLINENYENVKSDDDSYTVGRNILTFLDSNGIIVNMADLRQRFATNFINNYRVALFMENRREMLTSALFLYYKLCNEDEKSIELLNLAHQTPEDFISNHKGILKEILKTRNDDEMFAMIIAAWNNSFDESHPLNIIDKFVEVDNDRVDKIINSLNLNTSWIKNPAYSTSDSARYSNLMRDTSDIAGNAILSSLAIIRLLPWAFLVTTSSRTKARKLEMVKFCKDMMEELETNLSSVDMLYNSTSLLVKIEEIKYLMSLSLGLGNPIVERRIKSMSIDNLLDKLKAEEEAEANSEGEINED